MSSPSRKIKGLFPALALSFVLTLVASTPAFARTLWEVQWDLDVAYYELYAALDEENAAWAKLNQVGMNCGLYNSYDCWGWEYDMAMASLSSAQARVASADGSINALWAEYNRILNGGE